MPYFICFFELNLNKKTFKIFFGFSKDVKSFLGPPNDPKMKKNKSIHYLKHIEERDGFKGGTFSKGLKIWGGGAV